MKDVTYEPLVQNDKVHLEKKSQDKSRLRTRLIARKFFFKKTFLVWSKKIIWAVSLFEIYIDDQHFLQTDENKTEKMS